MKKTFKTLLALYVILSLAVTNVSAQDEYHKINRLEFSRTAWQMLVDAELVDDENVNEPFSDIDDEAVAGLYTNKIIYGKSEDIFEPDGLLTREEAAAITNRIYELINTEHDDASAVSDFKDAEQISEWAIESVNAMNNQGIIIGTPEGYFEPSNKLTGEHAELILLRLQKLCAPQAITQLSVSDALDKIIEGPRKIGTTGERKAAKYIEDTFKEYGYTVNSQEFEFAHMDAISKDQVSNKGINIIASKEASVQNPDILVISAHYDTVPGTVGANDNGSGMALLLELARTVKDIKTDTEIRFIAFSGEEIGLLGSTHYVNNLSEQEKSRIIGDIQIDMLGHYMSEDVHLATPNGLPTLVGNMINENAQKIMGSVLTERIESASDHMSFVTGGIPAVLITQDNIGVENHKVSDNASIIDAGKIKPIGDVLLKTIADVADDSTSSLSKKAYEVSDMKNPAYIFKDETIFYFGEKKQLNDGSAGGPGTLIGQRHDDEIDWDYEDYIYNVKWFGMEEVLPTVFEYRVTSSGRYLQNININTEEAGYSHEQTSDILEKKFGEPSFTSDNVQSGITDYIWEDKPHQKQYILTQKNGKEIISIYSLYYGSGDTINKYDLTQGIEKYKDVDPLEYKLLEFIEKLTANYPEYVDTLEVWSDGLSYQLGAAYLTDPEKNDKFTLRIDIADVFDKDGNFRNLDKTLGTFVHEFGHVITLNESQVDLSKKDPDKFYYNAESFREGSYISDFYNRFWKDLSAENGSELYSEKPELFVDQYSSQNVNEDIAESFMLFVLSNRPAGNSVAEQKISFFYDYPELVNLRESIRGNFGY